MSKVSPCSVEHVVFTDLYSLLRAGINPRARVHGYKTRAICHNHFPHVLLLNTQYV